MDWATRLFGLPETKFSILGAVARRGTSRGRWIPSGVIAGEAVGLVGEGAFGNGIAA